MLKILSALPIPLILGAVALLMLVNRAAAFESFRSGATEGIGTAVRLLPTLVALLCAVKMLTASGLLTDLAALCAPFLSRIGLQADLLPLLLTRPFSGSGAMALFDELLAGCGPDSFTAFCASVIMGSSDTAVYILTVYFSAVGVKKTRYAFPCALAVMLFGIFFCQFICRLWFK